MKINSKDFRVRPGDKVKLSAWPTIAKPFCKSKEQHQKLLREHVEELSSLQQLQYASNRSALLLIFQGMDAGGKDGAIRHVMSGVNPQGCQVFSFKQPSADELEHDFLWRTTRCLPERGRIGIFDRSYLRGSAGGPGASGDFSAARGFQKSCATRKRYGRNAIAPSWISKATSIATERELVIASRLLVQRGREDLPRTLDTSAHHRRRRELTPARRFHRQDEQSFPRSVQPAWALHL
jgi:hypothetical protein